MPFAVVDVLYWSRFRPSFRERDRDTPTFVLGLWRPSRFRRHHRPLWGTTTGRRRDGRGNGASSRYALNTLKYQWIILVLIFSVEYLDLEQPTNNPGSSSSKSSGRSHAYPHTSLSTLIRISRYPSLNAPADPRGASFMHATDRRSTAAMTSGSIETSPISINPVGGTFREEDEIPYWCPHSSMV